MNTGADIPSVLEVGVAAVVVLMILREVFAFLRHRRGAGTEDLEAVRLQYIQITSTMGSVANTLNSLSNVVTNTCVKLDKVYDRVDVVHEVTRKTWDMHNVFDDSGAPKWYNQAQIWKPAVEAIIKSQQTILTNHIELQRAIRDLTKAISGLTDLTQAVKELVE